MSRYDKYDPVSGGFRAPLLAAIVSADKDKIQGVRINSAGKVVIGATAETSIVGLICPVRAMSAGEIIDVMTSGEIVEATKTAGTAFTAGQTVTVAPSGAVGSTAAGAGFKAVGQMVELDRMIVRIAAPTTVEA